MLLGMTPMKRFLLATLVLVAASLVAARRDETVVRTAAHAVGRPFGDGVVVGGRPTAVGLEPSVRVAHGGLGVHDLSVAPGACRGCAAR